MQTKLYIFFIHRAHHIINDDRAQSNVSYIKIKKIVMLYVYIDFKLNSNKFIQFLYD